jgi:beta-galactosidase
MIEIKQNTFILNDHETFLFGGELHYFRVPKAQWADRLAAMKAAGLNLVSTYIPWQLHEPVEGQIDLHGTTADHLDLAGFMEAVKASGMMALVRPGPYVMSELTTDGIPGWLIQNYPQALALTQSGHAHHTKIFSYLHPIFVEKVKTWYKAVFDILEPLQMNHGGPIVMMQLDNEVGMFQWIVNQGDYSEVTLSHFVDFLQERFETLEVANKALNTSLNQWDDVIHLVKNLKAPYALPLHHEYGLFNRQFFTCYLKTLREIALDCGMDVPIVVNVHGFDQHDYAKRGLRYPIGLSQLKDTMSIPNSIMAGDYYIGNLVMDNYTDVIMADALTRSIHNPNQPLFSAEFQGGFQVDVPILQPTSIDLNARLCIADGMNGINYYMFVGGTNWHHSGLFGSNHDWQAPISREGTFRPSYFAIARLGKTLKALGESFVRSTVRSDVVIGWDPDVYMTEYWVNATRSMHDRLTHLRETALFGLGRSLAMNHLSYEAVDLTKPERALSTDQPLLVIGMTWMNASVQQRLSDFVSQGGHLVLINEVPTLDFYGKPCTILRDALGLVQTGIEYGSLVRDGEVEGINTSELHLYAHDGGWITSERTGQTAAFTKPIGKGKLSMIGVFMHNERLFKEALWGQWFAKIGIQSPYKTSDRVHLSERIDGSTTFISVLNLDEYRKTITVTKKNEVLFDGHPLILQSRQGMILPIDLPITSGIKLVYSTVELIDRQPNALTFDVSAKHAVIRLTGVQSVHVSHPATIVPTTDGIRITLINQDEQSVTLTFGGNA